MLMYVVGVLVYVDVYVDEGVYVVDYFDDDDDDDDDDD